MVSLSTILSISTLVSVLPAFAMAEFDPTARDNVVLYWGQAWGNDSSLADYCEKSAGDVYIISFFNQFGIASPSFNVEGCNTKFPGSDLYNCPQIGEDIKSCQNAGKKVFLSLGGADGTYGFSNRDQAEDFALDLWNWFGGGNSTTRPFGDAVVDGFNLDIEQGNSTGYDVLVEVLKHYFVFYGGSRTYYISASPNCVGNGPTMEIIQNAYVDFAYVQFYDNVCAAGYEDFSAVTWSDVLIKTSFNQNIKWYLGILGSASSGTGYLPPGDFYDVLTEVFCLDSFGGVMFWQASTAFKTYHDAVTYPALVSGYLDIFTVDEYCALVQNASSTTTSITSTISSTATSITSNISSTATSITSNISSTAALTSSTVLSTYPTTSSLIATVKYSNSSIPSTTSSSNILPLSSHSSTVTSASLNSKEILVTITTEAIATSTDIVTSYTTYCPLATQFVEGSSTYVVTEATTVTVTNCPCTRTKQYTTKYTTVYTLNELSTVQNVIEPSSATSGVPTKAPTEVATEVSTLIVPGSVSSINNNAGSMETPTASNTPGNVAVIQSASSISTFTNGGTSLKVGIEIVTVALLLIFVI